jgi:hypothetical protein
MVLLKQNQSGAEHAKTTAQSNEKKLGSANVREGTIKSVSACKLFEGLIPTASSAKTLSFSNSF